MIKLKESASKFKVGKFFKHKYSDGDVTFQIKKIKERSPDRVVIEVYWLGMAVSQDVVLTDNTVDNYEEVD